MPRRTVTALERDPRNKDSYTDQILRFQAIIRFYQDVSDNRDRLIDEQRAIIEAASRRIAEISADSAKAPEEIARHKALLQRAKEEKQRYAHVGEAPLDKEKHPLTLLRELMERRADIQERAELSKRRLKAHLAGADIVVESD